MEFHISRAFREKLAIDDLLFEFDGNVVFGNVAASRKLAAQWNELRGSAGQASDLVNAGALFAMGLIDELSHAVVARYREELDPAVMSEALRWFSKQLPSAQISELLQEFSTQFPTVAVYRGEITVEEWLAETTDEMPHREAALEELLLLWLANTNPAFAPFRELFDDRPLAVATPYPEITEVFPEYFATRPEWSSEAGTLLDVLRAPMLAAPDSLSGQLDFIRERWAPYLGEDLRRTLLAIDVLREEDIAIWMRFHPPAPGRPGDRGRADFGAAGFVGDEFIGFAEAEARRRRYAADHQAPLNEYEAFSEDQAWMPTVVLMAKSTYVWLEQLSKKYGRHIHRLDQIPDEELRLLASRGMTGLWLIGLWERSIASRTIKRLRGQEDSVASAYSLKDYQIAEDLGGPSAYEYLRDRAAAAGIRLASDMVPNHMGIDSTWVVEHPDWFISRPESPFPSYSFEGPDLSSDPRVEIKIEDHYFDQTDAAVVFRLRQQNSGETRFVYHGNDGTTFAWNDTAQLDYSKAYVREHVIQAILHVARLFPIIRFDAAMTLAKRHVQRLWFPLPGVGGSIPSRAESALTQEEFDALMPHEFWREVVDRVAVEVPGTLLLAEAFWMLEGYFVRTLGMHRVYNSAFMNMLRDEENAKYRSYLKKTIEFDPDILKRYVNFMSNPDERTTIDQFGSGDKCFGVATLMSTLPGLPMFGHGQIEGFTERYGMEYKRARMDESPNEGLAARHQQEIAPLLKRRHVFAESANFVMYDFWTDHGTVDENVFAYSNRSGDDRALILYNNTYGSTRGTIHTSVASMDKYTGQLRQRQLSEAMNLRSDEATMIGYHDATRGLSFLRRSRDFFDHGLTTDLRGYQYVVLQNFRELQSTAEQPWDQLCDSLQGAGVHNLEESLSKLRLRPLHQALRHALKREHIQMLLQVAQENAATTASAAGAKKKATPQASKAGAKGAEQELDGRLEALLADASYFFEQLHAFAAADYGLEELPSSPVDSATTLRHLLGALSRLPALEQTFSSTWPAAVRSILPSSDAAGTTAVWAPLLAWVLLHSSQTLVHPEIFDHLQLRSALAETFSGLDLHGEDGWRSAARVRLLLGPGTESAAALLGSAAFWQEGDLRWLAGINRSGGIEYMNKEQLEEVVSWLQLPSLVSIADVEAVPSLAVVEQTVARARTTAEQAGYAVDRFLQLWNGVTPPSSEGTSTRPMEGKKTSESGNQRKSTAQSSPAKVKGQNGKASDAPEPASAKESGSATDSDAERGKAASKKAIASLSTKGPRKG